MTFEQFLKTCYEFLSNSGESTWLCQSFTDPDTHNKSTDRGYDAHGLTFYATWSLGGTVGSCHDTSDEDVREVGADEEPADPPEIDAILEYFAPGISLMQYKRIVKEVMKRGATVHGDYYGGSITLAHKGVNIRELYCAPSSQSLLAVE
jgi:hypothetical protein